MTLVYCMGAKLAGAKSPWPLNFIQWRQVFASPQCGIWFMLPFWCRKFWGGCWIPRKLV